MLFTQTKPVVFKTLKGGHLTLNGVGFKMFTTSQRSLLQIGYSHYLLLRRLKDDLLRAKRQNVLLHPGDLSRSDLNQRLQSLKRPDPYKARGIYPFNNKPRTKSGKSR